MFFCHHYLLIALLAYVFFVVYCHVPQINVSYAYFGPLEQLQKTSYLGLTS
jgi:hypothetical protein